MGNNEVVIDGVNVAECMFVQTDHYLETPCCIMKIARNEVIGICKNRPNCYFKQLQRAKAENEKLKRLINMNLTTFNKCCVNGLIMNNNISEVLDEY